MNKEEDKKEDKELQYPQKIKPKEIFHQIKSTLLFRGAEKIGNIYKIKDLSEVIKGISVDSKDIYARRSLYMKQKKWAILDALLLAYFDKIIVKLILKEKLPENFPTVFKKMVEDTLEKKCSKTCILNTLFKPLVKCNNYYPTENTVLYLYKDLKKTLSEEEKNKLEKCPDNEIVEVQLNLLERFAAKSKCGIELYLERDEEATVKKYGNGESTIRVLVVNPDKESVVNPDKESPGIYILYDASEYNTYTS